MTFTPHPVSLEALILSAAKDLGSPLNTTFKS